MNMNINNAEITLKIRTYLEAKSAEKAAKAEAAKVMTEILSVMDGDTKAEILGADGKTYNLAAIYGKTRSVLSKENIESVYGITLDDRAYAVSKPWDELRVTVR
jgi:hypothetical protein